MADSQASLSFSPRLDHSLPDPPYTDIRMPHYRYRFCNYPQEILLRLEAPCKVHQLQILSHEYKASAAGASKELTLQVHAGTLNIIWLFFLDADRYTRGGLRWCS